MGKVLQTLTVDLTANTAQFSAAMTKASQISLSSAKSIQRSFTLISGAAIAAGAAVSGAVAGIVISAAKYVSSIEIIAQKTGFSTQELSKLSYAATLTGGNLEDLSGLLLKFSKNAGESASGNEKSQRAFSALGISVTDSAGRFRPASELFEEASAKLNAMPEGIGKTTLEMQLFGKSGAALAPILKVLGSNAAQTASDMKAFGLSISSETAEGAEKLTQTYERTKLALTGFGLTVFSTALPALQALADKVIYLAQDGSLQRWATNLGNDVTTAAQAASSALQFLSDHGSTLKTVIEGLVALQVASWLLSINTNALTSAGGIDVLVSSVGKAILKMSGLSGLATAAGAAITTVRGTTVALISLASTEGIVATGAYAMQTAWQAFSAAVLANPVTVVLAGIAGAFYIVYKALKDDVSAAEKLGGVAVTWADKWQAACDSTKERLSALKTLMFEMDPRKIGADLDRFNKLPNFGERAEAIAKARVAGQPTTTPSTVTPPPQPKPIPGPAKADPYKAELAKLNQELTNSQLALNAAMQSSVDAQRSATEAGKTGLIITELQTKLKRELNSSERAAITSAVRNTGENEHEVQVVESLRQRTDAAKDALATTQALALVIGQGAAAEDAAKRSIDTATLARELGVSASSKYAKAISDLLSVQKQSAQEQRELETAKEGQDLRQEASDTNALAYATNQGADALERMTLQLKIDAAERAHKGDNVDVTKQLTDAITEQAEAEQKLRAVQQGQAYTSPLDQYKRSIDAIARASQDAKAAGVQVDDQQVWLANRAAALSYQEQVERLHSAFGSASNGARDFFTDLRNQTLSAATMMHDLLSGAVSSFNEALAKTLTGQKANWSSFFRGISESITKMGIQKIEQSVVGKIMGPDKSKSDPALATTNSKLDTINSSILSLSGKGVGSIADSTSSSLVSDATSATGSGGGSGILAKLAGMATSFIPGLGGLGGLFGSLFGGHRALGGSVQAGMSYDVGEMGRETFTPSTSGTITPHSRASGGNTNYAVNVANGVTPEQMDMHVRSALAEFHPHVVRSSVAAMQQHQQRRPTSHR